MSTAQVTPYLFFGGRCEEALEFYKGAVGAQVDSVMYFHQSPEPAPPGMLPEGFDNKVMHADFRIGASTLFASDGDGDFGPAGDGVQVKGFMVALSLPTAAEVESAFAGLSDGGQVQMPVGQTFWSPCFGMVTDRFGIGWMVSVAAA